MPSSSSSSARFVYKCYFLARACVYIHIHIKWKEREREYICNVCVGFWRECVYSIRALMMGSRDEDGLSTSNPSFWEWVRAPHTRRHVRIFVHVFKRGINTFKIFNLWKINLFFFCKQIFVCVSVLFLSSSKRIAFVCIYKWQPWERAKKKAKQGWSQSKRGKAELGVPRRRIRKSRPAELPLAT